MAENSRFYSLAFGSKVEFYSNLGTFYYPIVGLDAMNRMKTLKYRQKHIKQRKNNAIEICEMQ